MIKALKSSLELKVSFTIDSIRACRKLERILYEKGYFVSYTTLSRIFSIAKKTASPREETLHLLARFLGYDSYDIFVSIQQKINTEESVYVHKSLEFKSNLLTGQYYQAIDQMDEIRALSPSKHRFFSQYLGKAVFGQKNRDQRLIDYLLHKDFKDFNFQEFFVYEDDPYGHFQWSLEKINPSATKSDDRILFENLFLHRKKFICGRKITKLPEIDPTAHFHLYSRYLELRLLSEGKKMGIKKTTDWIIDEIEKNEDPDCHLSFVGRWCRALIYSNNYSALKAHEEWKKACLSTFMLSRQNLEFKSPIFTFLKLVHGEQLPLEFYLNNIWDNALVESQLIISMAFNQKKTVENYKKFLKMKLPL
jgi:hypothetical protein